MEISYYNPDDKYEVGFECLPKLFHTEFQNNLIEKRLCIQTAKSSRILSNNILKLNNAKILCTYNTFILIQKVNIRVTYDTSMKIKKLRI